jgi:hypothetical protein
MKDELTAEYLHELGMALYLFQKKIDAHVCVTGHDGKGPRYLGTVLIELSNELHAQAARLELDDLRNAADAKK